MNRLCIKSIALVLFFTTPGSTLFAQVKCSEELWALPTYKVMQPEKAPVFFTHGNYQGASQYVPESPLRV